MQENTIAKYFLGYLWPLMKTFILLLVAIHVFDDVVQVNVGKFHRATATNKCTTQRARSFVFPAGLHEKVVQIAHPYMKWSLLSSLRHWILSGQVRSSIYLYHFTSCCYSSTSYLSRFSQRKNYVSSPQWETFNGRL